MARQNIYDIIKNTPFDAKKECARISQLFCSCEDSGDQLYDLVNGTLLFFPEEFRGRALSLDDFNKTYGFDFCRNYQAETIDDLISYCEYVISLCDMLEAYEYNPLGHDNEYVLEMLRNTIISCMEAIGQVAVKKGCFTIFVDKDPTILAVSESVKPSLASAILEYNHRRLKGNLNQKHLLLKLFADDFESKRGQLKAISGSVESQLGQLMNKFVRHDHSKTPYIATLSESELEAIYDDIYQMYLLANLQLDHQDRKNRITKVLSDINK